MCIENCIGHKSVPKIKDKEKNMNYENILTRENFRKASMIFHLFALPVIVYDESHMLISHLNKRRRARMRTFLKEMQKPNLSYEEEDGDIFITINGDIEEVRDMITRKMFPKVIIISYEVNRRIINKNLYNEHICRERIFNVRHVPSKIFIPNPFGDDVLNFKMDKFK